MVNSTPAKTLNSRPTKVSELNVPLVDASVESDLAQRKSLWHRFLAGYRNVNLVLAGMYTGVTCYGVPHEKHQYADSSVDSTSAQSDDGAS